MNKDEIINRYFRTESGLRVHYLDMAPVGDVKGLPVVCLPGLARAADDFLPIGLALAGHSATPRRVIAVDYRGRGRSDRDPDWRNYSLDVERADFLGILRDVGIERAHFIGTSRGGLHILGLAAARRDLIKAAIFNDIGPVLERAGLARIKGYIGKSVAPTSIEEAVTLLKSAGGRHFEGLSPAEWRHFAETTFGRDEASLGLRYDPQLARTLDTFDLDKPIPQSWDLFDKLTGAPVLTIRGANSDLLSEATLAAMGARWRQSQTMTVPGQGHAPLLADQRTMSRIGNFLAEADSTGR